MLYLSLFISINILCNCIDDPSLRELMAEEEGKEIEGIRDLKVNQDSQELVDDQEVRDQTEP